MVTTIDILDLLKEKYGSDYKAAEMMGMNRKRISQLRNVGGSLTDEQGLKAAELLDFPKEFIVLSLAAERSFKSPVHEILSKISDKFDPRKAGAVAACILVALGAMSDGFLTIAGNLPA